MKSAWTSTSQKTILRDNIRVPPGPLRAVVGLQPAVFGWTTKQLITWFSVRGIPAKFGGNPRKGSLRTLRPWRFKTFEDPGEIKGSTAKNAKKGRKVRKAASVVERFDSKRCFSWPTLRPSRKHKPGC